MGCGSYRFQIHTDDGVRFWVNNQLLLDAWFDQVGYHEVSADLNLGAHHFKIEHYENGGQANLTLNWSRDAFCSPPGSIFLPFVRSN